MVLTVYQSTGAAHPVTSFKSFNWDQAYRKAITYDTLWQADTDPLKVVFPIVQADLQKQAAETGPIARLSAWTRRTTSSSPSPMTG